MEKSLITFIQALVVAEIQKIEIEQVPIFVEGELDMQVGLNADFLIGTNPMIVCVGKPIPHEYIYLPMNTVTFRHATLMIKVFENKEWMRKNEIGSAYDVSEIIVKSLAGKNKRFPKGHLIIKPLDQNSWKVFSDKKNDNINIFELQFNIYFFPEISELKLL